MVSVGPHTVTLALTHPAHQVHFEGITGVSNVVESALGTDSTIKAYNAKDVYKATKVGAYVDGGSTTTEMKASTTVGMFYPGAVYDDAAGQKQLVANMGHFGRLDSIEGAAKRASMNVFTAADGGK